MTTDELADTVRDLATLHNYGVLAEDERLILLEQADGWLLFLAAGGFGQPVKDGTVAVAIFVSPTTSQEELIRKIVSATARLKTSMN